MIERVLALLRDVEDGEIASTPLAPSDTEPALRRVVEPGTPLTPHEQRVAAAVHRAGRGVADRTMKIVRRGALIGDSPTEVAEVVQEYLDPAYRAKRTSRGRLIANQIIGRISQLGRGKGTWPARLIGRHEMSQAHAAAARRVADLDPFTDGIKWSLSPRHPGVDECDENAENSSPGLPPGVYRAGDLPHFLNHYGDLCHVETWQPTGEERRAIAIQQAIDHELRELTRRT